MPPYDLGKGKDNTQRIIHGNIYWLWGGYWSPIIVVITAKLVLYIIEFLIL